MRSVAWGLLKRTAKRAVERPPIVTTRRIHITAPSLTSAPSPASFTRTTFDPLDRPHPHTNDQLLTYLNSDGPANASDLPAHLTLLDAYLRLKETYPQALTRLTDEGLARLCEQAGIKRLGGVVGSLVDDLEGESIDDARLGDDLDFLTDVPLQLREASVINNGGIFKAPPGSKRRLHAVQSLLTGASRKRMSTPVSEASEADEFEDKIGFIESLISSSVLERAFNMLMHDFRTLKQEQGHASSESMLPRDFDPRVIRRLIRTISITGNTRLVNILGELIRHNKRFDDNDVAPFPQAMEGCYLIEYYLGVDETAVIDPLSESPPSSSSNEMPQNIQAAYYILGEMIAADPSTISDALVDTASREGHRYSSHLASGGVPQAQAYNKGLSYALRNVIINVLLKKSRYILLQDQLLLLVNEIKQTAAEFGVTKTKTFFTRLIRTGINLALASRTAFPAAFTMAKMFPEIWPQELESEGSGTLLRTICECAIREGKEEEALQILEIVLTQTRPPREQLASAAVHVGAEAICSILRRQARNGRGDVVGSLLERMGIVNREGNVLDDAIDQLFTPTLRADFIALIAEAGLKPQTRALYERWGAPMNYIVDSNMVQRHFKQVVQTPISERKPAGHESSAGSSEDLSASVVQSSKCMIRLVKLFAGRTSKRNLAPSRSEVTADGSASNTDDMAPRFQVQFAYHVLFQFLDSKTSLSLLKREQLVRLASAYYFLDQRTAAFKCLADIMRREEVPTIDEAVEMLRLLSSINLEKSVNLLLDRVSYWTKTKTTLDRSGDKDSLSRLYSPLLGKCLFRKEYKLAEKLMASARDNDLNEQLSMRAMNGLIKYALDHQDAKQEQLSSRGKQVELYDTRLREAVSSQNAEGERTIIVANWVKSLMEKDRWRPDPAILSWLINKALLASSEKGEMGKESKSVKLRNGFLRGQQQQQQQKRREYTTANKKREAATLLLSLSAKHLGYVSYSTVSEVLRSIQHKAYFVRRKLASQKSDHRISTGLQSLTYEIDRVVKVIRWVQVLGRSDQIGILDEDETLSIVPTGQAATTPNQPLAYLFRFLIVSYLRVGDVMGAANVMIWAREEANLSFEDLERGWDGDVKGFRNYLKDIAYQAGTGARAERAPRDILALLAGTVPVSRTKSWWDRPDSFI